MQSFQAEPYRFRFKTSAIVLGFILFFVGVPFFAALSIQTASSPPSISLKPRPRAALNLPHPRPDEQVPGIYLPDQGFHNQVVLTFDDGPNVYTAQVLDILRRHRIKAVFFIVGSKIQKRDGTLYPQMARLLRRIQDEGHGLGNHSFNHANLSHAAYLAEPEKIAMEFQRTEKAVNRALRQDYPLIYVRPPYGQRGVRDLVKLSEGVYRQGLVDQWLLQAHKYLVLWSAGAGDWDDKLSLESMEDSVMQALDARQGGVVLLHDIHPRTPILLEKLLMRIEKEKRFKFTTLESLLNRKYPLETALARAVEQH